MSIAAVAPMAALGPVMPANRTQNVTTRVTAAAIAAFEPVRRPGAHRRADHDQHGACARQPEMSDELVPYGSRQSRRARAWRTRRTRKTLLSGGFLRPGS